MKNNECINVKLNRIEIDNIFENLFSDFIKFDNELRDKSSSYEEYISLRDNSVLFQLVIKFYNLKSQ